MIGLNKMDFKMDKNQQGTKLYTIALFIWVAYFGLVITSNVATYLNNNILQYGVSGLVIAMLVIKEYLNIPNGQIRIRPFTFAVFLVMFSLYVWTSRYQSGILTVCIFLFVASARDVELNAIFKAFLWAITIVLVGTVLLSRLGLISILYMASDDGVRGSLGFKYVSFGSQYSLFFILCYLIIRSSKIRWIEIIFLYIIAFYFHSATATSNPFYLSLLVITYALISEKVVKKGLIVENKFLKIITPAIYFVVLGVLLYLCFFASSGIYSTVDSMVHNRLRLGKQGIELFGVPMLGQKVTFITLNMFNRYDSNYNYIDSSYLQSLVVNGWLFTVLILILFSLSLKWVVDHKYDILAACMVIAAIHGMFDPQMTVLWYSPFILMIGKIFNPSDTGKKLAQRYIEDV